jgi:hypothetical protein
MDDTAGGAVFMRAPNSSTGVDALQEFECGLGTLCAKQPARAIDIGAFALLPRNISRLCAPIGVAKVVDRFLVLGIEFKDLIPNQEGTRKVSRTVELEALRQHPGDLNFCGLTH